MLSNTIEVLSGQTNKEIVRTLIKEITKATELFIS